MEEDLIDKEELEARLYEKIYYSVHRTEDNMDCNFNSPSTPSDGSKSTNGDTEVPDQNGQKSSKHKDSVGNNNDELTCEKTSKNPSPKKKKRTMGDEAEEPKRRLSEKQLRKEKKRQEMKEMRKAAKEKKLRLAQKKKVLKKRKEIREKASNPLKSAQDAMSILKLHFQETEDDDEDCLIVEDEPEPARKKQNSSSQLDEAGKYSTETKGQKSSKADEGADESDSDESILEVPVPPKPPPVIVDLDSDDNNRLNDKDEDPSEEEGANTMAVESVEHFEVIDETGTDSDQGCDELEVTLESEEIEEESQDMILNCTPVKKGVSSLEEIKRLRKNAQEEENQEEEMVLDNNLNIQEDNCQEVVENVEESEPRRIITRSQTRMKKSKDYFPPMTKKMQDFYNESWGGEDFELEKIRSEMSNDPRRWAILDEDMRPKNAANRYYEVCKSCNKPGHSRRKCPTEKRRLNVKTCHMCGSNGHFETRCPQRMCLTCGKAQNTYRKTCENCRKLRCTTCHAVGHSVEHCPDNWRRFHNITTEEEWASSEAPINTMKPRKELHCCNCTQKGHDSSSCSRYRWSQHFPTPSFVTNYSSYGNLPEPELLRNPYASNRTPASSARVEPSEPEIIPPTELPACEQEQPSDNQVSESPAVVAPPIAAPTTSSSEYATKRSTNPLIVIKLFGYKSKWKIHSHPVNHQGDDWANSLREGGCDATLLFKLHSSIPFGFELGILQGKQLLLQIRCASIVNVEYLRNIIISWLTRTEEERTKMILLPMRPKDCHSTIMNYFQRLCTPAREPDIVYNELKQLEKEAIKFNDIKTLAKYDDIRVEMNISFIKYGVGKKPYMITQMFVKNWYAYKTASMNKRMFVFLPLLHYTNLIFSVYTSKKIQEKVKDYVDKRRLGQLGEEYDFNTLFGQDVKKVLKDLEKNKVPCQKSTEKTNKPGKKKQAKSAKQVPNVSSSGPSNQQANNQWNQNLSLWNQRPPRSTRWGPSNIPTRNISQNQLPATNQANVIQYIQNIVEQPMPNNVQRFGSNCPPGSSWVMNNPNNFIPDAPINPMDPVQNAPTNRYRPENYMYENPANDYRINNVNNGIVINSSSNNYTMNTSNNNFIMNSPNVNVQNQPNNASHHPSTDLHQRALNLIMQIKQVGIRKLDTYICYLHRRIGKKKLTENDVKKVRTVLKRAVQPK